MLKQLGSTWWSLLFLLMSGTFSPLVCEEIPPGKILFITDKLRMSGADQAFLSLMNGWAVRGSHVEILLKQRGGILESRLRKDFSVISYKKAKSRTYDVAVCYAEWLKPDAGLKKIQARRKVQWIHTDLLATPHNFPFKHASFCEGIDAFVCVSEKAADSFKKLHPHLCEKVSVVHNVLDGDLVRRRAVEGVRLFPHDGICNIVSVARLSQAKALDRAIRVHSRLDKEGIKFRWYVVGDGPLRNALERQVKGCGLQNRFIFLGQKLNPYPYVFQADIFALPSLFEGFSIAVNEAKILGKPILFTDVAGAREQIESEVNGLIVANNEEAIYHGLKRLLQDKELRCRFEKALQGFRYDNQPIYDKVEHVLFP